MPFISIRNTYFVIFCLVLWKCEGFDTNRNSLDYAVRVFYLINAPYWGDRKDGNVPCNCCRSCDWFSGNNISVLSEIRNNSIRNKLSENDENTTIDVSLYNIHSWRELSNGYYGPSETFRTHFDIAESEESHSRFIKLFRSFRYFDGYTTTNPQSDIPRYYQEAYLNASTFLKKKPFSALTKAAVYVSSTCARHAFRDRVVKELRRYIRIDSIGRCHRSNPLPDMHFINDSLSNQVYAKQLALSNYMFYLAFENTIEPGYVTEKVFDGLIAGHFDIHFNYYFSHSLKCYNFHS